MRICEMDTRQRLGLKEDSDEEEGAGYVLPGVC